MENCSSEHKMFQDISAFDLSPQQWKDAGVLRDAALDELCEQVHQEPEALRPAAFSMGRGRGAQQVGPKAGCVGAGNVSSVYFLLFWLDTLLQCNLLQ